MRVVCPPPRETLECPPNFGMVIPDVYRSSFPRQEHLAFIKSLKLRTILVLIPEPYPEENMEFVRDNNITLYQIGLSGNKEPFVNMSPKDISRALQVALDKNNYPLLIHCNQGKHRTGCVVGCMRRIEGWALSIIFDEYRRHAFPKARALDQLLIERYQPETKTEDENGREV